MISGSMHTDGKGRLHIILISYFSISLYFFFFGDFKYMIDPDLTSYISIAQKYLNGDYANAINGHWSPMVSWLALPLLSLKISPILAFSLMSVGVGGLTLAGIHLLMQSIGIGERISFLYTLAFVPLIALYALTEGNPDLLSLCILVYYLHIVIQEDFRTNKYRGIVAGALGAGAYLVKSYNFYFFLLHFSCLNFLHWYHSSDQSERSTICFNAIAGVLIFLLISGMWIGLLANKYHTVTVSTAGNYNFSFIRPGSPGQMVDTDGLLAPPNETAYSAWEDPTYIKKIAWSPFDSNKDLLYFLKNTAKNTATYFLYLHRKPLVFVTLLCFIAILIPFRLRSLDNKPFYLFLTTLLHPIGYLLLYIEERYVWIDFIALYILSAYLVEGFSRKIEVIKIKRSVLLALICAYLSMVPIASLFYFAHSEEYLPHLKNIYFLSREMHDFQRANIASQVDNWCDDLYLTYYLDGRYYGKVKSGITDEQLKKELIDYKINYYVVHGELKNHIDILRPDKTFGDITVYKVAGPISAG